MNSTFVNFNFEMNALYNGLVHNFVTEFLFELGNRIGYTPWLFSLLGSVVIGLSGILPLLIIPSDEKLKEGGYKHPAESKFLKVLLSFAVGGLLGDVFLHLLPEAWEGSSDKTSTEPRSMRSGLWVLAGLLIFTIVEKIFADHANAEEEKPQPKTTEVTNCQLHKTGDEILKGDCCDGFFDTFEAKEVPNCCCSIDREKKQKDHTKKIAGYLNLIANSIDNFTHGLAVAGSFLVSFRHGLLATFAILLHEIPHEVGDFAILLRSGFSRWDAARAQLLTAGAGLLGALVAIGGSGVTSAMEARTSWIMPFTAGGFLHIALVTVLPDLLKEQDKMESIKQFLALIFGIGLIATMSLLFDGAI